MHECAQNTDRWTDIHTNGIAITCSMSIQVLTHTHRCAYLLTHRRKHICVCVAAYISFGHISLRHNDADTQTPTHTYAFPNHASLNIRYVYAMACASN